MISRFFQLFALLSATILWSAPMIAIAASEEGDPTQSILHSLDYMAVDYPQVVIHGEIISASEYQEQREFAAAALSLITKLPDHSGKAEMEEQAQQLVNLVSNRFGP